MTTKMHIGLYNGLNEPLCQVKTYGFTQFVLDNADFNVATLTGHNTFHSMGGIACVTPPGSITHPSSVK